MAKEDSKDSQVTVKFTEFNNGTTREGVDVEASWSGFADVLMSEGFPIVTSKEAASLLVPVEWKSGSKGKFKENVARVYIGSLDFDDLTDEQLQGIGDRIQEEGLSALIYATWQYAAYEDVHRVRLLIPFSRPVESDQWQYLWPLLNGLFGGLGDGSCKDPSRGYYMPAASSEEVAKKMFIYRFKGEALDVDKLLAGIDTMAAAELAVEESVDPINKERVRRFAQKMSRSSVEYKAWMGVLLLKVLKGEPFAEKGDRDNTVFKLAKDLGTEYPDKDPQSIAEVFRPSLSNMGSDAPTVSLVADKIRRAQKSVLAERLNEDRSKILQKKLFKEQTGAPDSYDKAFIDEFCKKTGCGSTFENFEKRLIVQRKNTYYVFFVNTYYPFIKEELVNACRDLLMPAMGKMRASIYNVSDKGLEVPKAPLQLVHDYGVVAQRQEARLYEQASYYDEKTKTMVEAVCPMKPLQAKKHPEVDEWISALCGNDDVAERFREWMSGVPDLTRPLALLALVGHTGVGKTQFAHGIARLWGESAIAMQNAFQPFNDQLMQCPVLLADEALPTDYRGRVPTDRLRNLISSGEHEINPKGKAVTPLLGYFRLIAAVNSREGLRFGKVYTKADVEAIQLRTLIIDVEEAAADLFDYQLFVEQGAIAEHTLWLHENGVKSSGRFGMTKKSASSISLVQDETTEHILDWLIANLEQRRLEEDKDIPAFVLKDDLYINADLLHLHWSSYSEKEDKRPNKFDVRRAVKLITAEENQLRVRFPTGTLRWYRKLNLDLLRQYVESSEQIDYQMVELQLMIYTGGLFSENSYAKISSVHNPTGHDRERKKFAERKLERLRDADPEEEEEEEEPASRLYEAEDDEEDPEPDENLEETQ